MKYQGKDNHGNPKADYVSAIAAKTDSELEKETEQKIWLSAYAANNPRSDYHWQVDACYDECKSRQKPDIYSKAYNKASAQ